jgi:hypothetical protein
LLDLLPGGQIDLPQPFQSFRRSANLHYRLSAVKVLGQGVELPLKPAAVSPKAHYSASSQEFLQSYFNMVNLPGQPALQSLGLKVSATQNSQEVILDGLNVSVFGQES